MSDLMHDTPTDHGPDTPVGRDELASAAEPEATQLRLHAEALAARLR
jgi:hypothetical protein